MCGGIDGFFPFKATYVARKHLGVGTHIDHEVGSDGKEIV